MIGLPGNTGIWIAAGVTDMRRGFTGLSAQVQTTLEQQPLSGHVFLFRGRRGDQIKMLWFDGDGLCLFRSGLNEADLSGRRPAVAPFRLRRHSSSCCSKASTGEDRWARPNDCRWSEKRVHFALCLQGLSYFKYDRFMPYFAMPSLPLAMPDLDTLGLAALKE